MFIRYFSMNIFNLIFEKTRRAVSQAFRQGSSRNEIAWALSFGIIVGIFPVYGATMPLLALIGCLKKWNHLLLQTANWMVSPLKPLMILPHIRLGEWLLHAGNPFELGLAEFTLRFREAPLETLGAFSMTFLHAMLAWLLHAPFSLLLVYLLARMLLSRTSLDSVNPEAPEPDGTPL